MIVTEDASNDPESWIIMIREYEKLKEGWDGYYAQPFPKETIQNAIDFVRCCSDLNITEIYPDGDRICFSFIRNDIEIAIKIASTDWYGLITTPEGTVPWGSGKIDITKEWDK